MRFLLTLAASFVFFTLAGFFIGRSPVKLATSEVVSARELAKELVAKEFVFVNVHTPYEGEIAKTDSFIQYDEMLANKNLLPKDKKTPIVLYCKTGRMSAEALTTLKGMGYTNVRHLEGGMDAWQKARYKILDLSKLPEEVLPKEGFTLPVSWGDVGPRLTQLGVIDLTKFEEAVSMTDEQRKILTEGGDIPIKIDNTSSQFVVDLLWALGLAQKSIVYNEGPLGKEYKNEQGNFASTGGWTLARRDALNYLNKFELISLTPEQQKRVGEIAKNVYRPCCGNPTWFPDCNHGMAALAIVELLVAKGLSDAEIYQEVLKLNSFWFPDNYLLAATYFARQGTA
ncbi:MAG: rhodanese-like domain-containing protein, partial [Patescibacteria group bacterium]